MDAELDRLLGTLADPMPRIDEAIRGRFGNDAIVWEGDASTFQYGYVNDAAERLLGFPATRWLGEPTFWADVVVHALDREEAVSYCALATGLKRHHVFDYRARAQDGRVIWFRDYVKVLLGPKTVPQRLRGFMLDVTSHYADLENHRALKAPSRDELISISA